MQQYQTLRRIGVWVGWLCIVRVITVLLIAQRDWILRTARILADWAFAPQVVLWTFLVGAVGLLIAWERMSPTQIRK